LKTQYIDIWQGKRGKAKRKGKGAVRWAVIVTLAAAIEQELFDQMMGPFTSKATRSRVQAIKRGNSHQNRFTSLISDQSQIPCYRCRTEPIDSHL
jgi:hypothetical protein